MGCEPSYTDYIRRQSELDMSTERTMLQWVRSRNWCVSAGLGRSGQSVLPGLYRPSKHCWASGTSISDPGRDSGPADTRA